MERTFVTLCLVGPDTDILYAGPDEALAKSFDINQIEDARKLVVSVWENGVEIGRIFDGDYVSTSILEFEK